MPSADYYRKQAQLCAKLAGSSADRRVVSRYHVMTLEYLARAEELEPSGHPLQRMLQADGGSDMDRD